jgi:hypothetical protein
MKEEKLDYASQVVNNLRNGTLEIKAECPSPLREVLQEIVEHPEIELAWKKHTEHSRSSQKGCVMGCLGG